MISASASPIFGTKHVDANATKRLKVALIGPDEKRRSAVAKALDATRRATTLEYDSYPPETDHLQELLASFDAIVLDLDSDPDVAIGIVGKMRSSGTTTTMVYSKNSDPKLAIRMMRAGAHEYLLLPLDRGAVSEALDRAANTIREKEVPVEKTPGELLVFAGRKGEPGLRRSPATGHRAGPELEPERPAHRLRTSHWRRGTVPGNFRQLFDGGRAAEYRPDGCESSAKSPGQASVGSFCAGGSHQSSRS